MRPPLWGVSQEIANEDVTSHTGSTSKGTSIHLAHGGYNPDIFVDFISHTGCEDIEIRLDT